VNLSKRHCVWDQDNIRASHLQGKATGKQADYIDLFCEAIDTVIAIKGAAILITVWAPALRCGGAAAAALLPVRIGKRGKTKLTPAAAATAQSPALKVHVSSAGAQCGACCMTEAHATMIGMTLERRACVCCAPLYIACG
jgi:hypothetical protein